ncbi:Enoyl-CoA hydratase/isomerase (plasmid) [Haloterrigena turkmenica DSM 5511]|uniref:Enoyl-CoA hydratase/isomerase n=1 Tax=Haloterrigena turkmenica (strain ATCC 51198 / DSM 5511 / JCM 9101 / NCIMB 13204 / VKM B-1734 / 4k) TaxID=543526 RepID=D2RZV2_HALTV|nr:enoyl-CoA hydratase/isomerase family protein [Haloterrigena turkmenica]ADB62649.1 Enoyl-CoA hydratase/isomerase [Haloterrigena turkmenica DSM 5511]
MYEDIGYDVEDGVATLTIDRPDVKNAFREATLDELNDAVRRADEDEGVYALVLTGAGDAFCAGADVRSMPDWSDGSKEAYAGFLWKAQNVVRQLRSIEIPAVAAVAGPAIGAGCDFALGCDLRVVDPDVKLRQGFVKVGLVPGDGGAWLLPKLIGESKAREYLLTGRDITADDAVDLGLAVDVDEEPLDGAYELVDELLDNPAHAVRRTKALIDPSLSFEEYCERAIEYQWECVNDEEHEEAVAAFGERREPEYDRDYS